MSYKGFRDMRLSRVARDRYSYRQTVRRLPRIGDEVPSFLTDFTQSPIAFHASPERSWDFLFSRPVPFTPICTTELASFGAAQAEFEEPGVKLLGSRAAALRTRLHGIPTSLGSMALT